MIVRKTAQVQEQIDAYKRFLEKPELFNHAALLDGQTYYNVQYWRWGKNEAVGYLILRSDGSVPPRSEAIPVVRLFMSHNNAAVNLKQQLAIDKQKPVWMYQQKRDYLCAILPAIEAQMNPQLRQDATNFIEMCEEMARSVDELLVIYDRGMIHLQEMLARNYVVLDDEKHLRDVLFESDFLMYRRLKRQVELIGAVDRLYRFLKACNGLSGEQKKSYSKLMALLSQYIRAGIRESMTKSVRDMELNGPSYSNAEEMIKTIGEKNKEIFQNKLFPILRNS